MSEISEWMISRWCIRFGTRFITWGYLLYIHTVEQMSVIIVAEHPHHCMHNAALHTLSNIFLVAPNFLDALGRHDSISRGGGGQYYF